MFLSAAVYTWFLLPQIYVLSKCNLLPEEDLESILEWSEAPEASENTKTYMCVCAESEVR